MLKIHAARLFAVSKLTELLTNQNASCFITLKLGVHKEPV